MSAFLAACIQMCAGTQPDDNAAQAARAIRRAARRGAQLILTPEMTGMIEERPAALFAKARAEKDDLVLKDLRGLAAELQVWLLIGSLAVRAGPQKLANRAFLIDPQGRIKSRYDKIHMFDADLPGGQVFRESRHYRPGAAARLADLPWGKIGLTICYDLRFPALYRHLARAGADFIAAPSAFTHLTGKAHWHVLLRARAIETGCFLFAPAQGGRHPSGRRTYGHSLIVDPWGTILAARNSARPGLIFARIDPAAAAAARARLPVLSARSRFA